LRRFFDGLFVVGAFESFMRITADGKNPACGHGKLPFRREHYRTLSHRRLSGLLSAMYFNTTSSLAELSKTAHF